MLKKPTITKGDQVVPSPSNYALKRGLKRGRVYTVKKVRVVTYSVYPMVELEGVEDELSSKHLMVVDARERRLAAKPQGFKKGDLVKPKKLQYATARGLAPEGPLRVTATNGVTTRAGQYICLDGSKVLHASSSFVPYTS